MTLEIGTAEVGDAAQIATVHRDAWRSGYAGIVPDSYLKELELDERIKRWRTTLASPPPGWTMAVARLNGLIVGFVAFGPCRPHAGEHLPVGLGEVYALYVAPSSWGSGAGSTLLLNAETALASTYSDAVVWVLSANERARRLYDARGWRPDGTIMNRDLGASIPSLRYHKALLAAAEASRL